MSKEERAFWTGLALPLVLAIAGWVNAHAQRVAAQAEREAKYELADGYREYIESVMKGEECPPCEVEE